MDRNSIIAIVLCVIVITVGMTVNSVFFAPDYTNMEIETVEQNEPADEIQGAVLEAIGDAESNEPFVIETEAFTITMEPDGASLSSIKLNKHIDSITREPVEVILKDSDGRNAFLLYTDTDMSQPIKDTFNYEISEDEKLIYVDFSREFTYKGSSFEISKSFAIPKSEEYLFRVNVSMKSLDGSDIPLTFYALGYDPQIGPSYTTLSNSYGEYRRMYYKEANNNKRRNVSFSNGESLHEGSLGWASTAGKYFAVIGVPDQNTSYETEFRQEEDDQIIQSNSFYFIRNSVSGTSFTDTYNYYIGPKLASNLNSYNVAGGNVFGYTGLNFNEILDSSAWLGWLQTILRWILSLFYSITHNYGVAIILLTILIKLLIQPLAKKGQDSTAKMAALTPKIEEIKQKYADDPNQMNIAMSKLYKDQGISPMGSCLPMLIQFPIFIALYGLLSTHFELRGSMFIPGWIPDLSVPDTIATLPFSIPFLGNEIHILPIIYVASMIFSMKITQITNTQAGQQGMMAFMTYGMPIIFFFILYNAPAGLLLYWTVMNFISISQQAYVNKKKTQKYADEIREKEEAKINKYKPHKKRKK